MPSGGRDLDDDRFDIDDYPGNGAFSFDTTIFPSFTFDQLPGTFHRIAGNVGTTISFADGHVLFWQYVNPAVLTTKTNGLPGGLTPSSDMPDLIQLEAWSGGPIPPNVVP